MKQLAAVIYHFLLEFCLGLLILFFYYIESKQLPPIISLLILCLAGLTSLILLVKRYSEKGKWLYFFIVLPLMIAAGTYVDFSIYTTSLIGVFIFWRGLSLYSDYSGHSETLFLYLSFLIGILLIIYSSVLHYPYQILIVSLLILQIILVLSGLFLSKWSSVGEDRFRFIAYFFKIIGAAALVGAGITFILKYIQSIFFGIFTAVAYIFSYLSIPVLKVIQFFINLVYQGERKPQVLKVGPGNFTGAYREYAGFNLNFVYLLIFIAVIAALIYYIKKKKVNGLVAGGYLSTVEFNSDELGQERGLFFKKRIKPPEDPIRREVFFLERYAVKVGLERLPFETLDEWWQRIGLTDTSAINKIYAKIRYGAVPSTLEEQACVKEVSSTLKQKMKEIAINSTGT